MAARLFPTDGGVGLRIYMQAPTGGLEVCPRAGFRGLVHRLGHVGFDDRWVVRGTMAERAFLAPCVRHMLDEVAPHLQVRRGWLVWDEARPMALDGEGVAERIERMARLSDALWEVPQHEVTRLEAMVLSEPASGVRWRALAGLTRENPFLARRLAFRALLDSNAQVRWVAARIAGAGGVLAALCLSEGVSVAIRRAAARDLMALRDPERQLLAATGLQASSDGRLQRLAAQLAIAAGSRGEPVLVGLLDASRGAVVRAAVRGLCRIGGVGALRPLRMLLRRTARFGTLYPEVRTALDVLLVRCSTRVGAVTIATPAHGGEVSLAALAARCGEISEWGPTGAVAARS